MEDLLGKASHPDRLRVAIAWQYGPGEERLESELRRWSQVELIKCPAEQSRGCNWARSLLQEAWEGERYTLFLDSHHRFVPAWDETVLRMHADLRRGGVAKPVVTGYLPAYDPEDDPHARVTCVLRIRSQERERGLLFRLNGHEIRGALRAPEPAHFASLHFLFADGEFNREVVFDPDVYFFADEVAIALRAFTHGYDLFHPHRVLGWHAYDRATRVTHWADHPEWRQQNEASCERLRALYSGGLEGRHGLGAERSVSDYERLIGTPLIEPPRSGRDPWSRAMRWHESRGVPGTMLTRENS